MWTQERQVYDRSWAEQQEYVPSSPTEVRRADVATRPRPLSSITRTDKVPANRQGGESSRPWWERLHTERTGNAYRGPGAGTSRVPLERKTRDQRLKEREMAGSDASLSGIGLDGPRAEYRPTKTGATSTVYQGAGMGGPAAGVRERPRSATSTSRPRNNYCFDTPGWNGRPAWGS